LELASMPFFLFLIQKLKRDKKVVRFLKIAASGQALKKSVVSAGALRQLHSSRRLLSSRNPWREFASGSMDLQ
jgi:hypothetical protein